MGQSITDYEHLYQLLSDEILQFKWKPGDRLSENDLCQRFSLSRTPVRSLLQRLQENGLVQIEPKRGSIVTRLNLDTINQLIYERVAIETMVLRDYITSATPADVEHVRYFYSQMEKAAADYSDDQFQPDAFRKADLAMHGEWFRQMRLNEIWSRLTGPQSSYTRFCVLDIMAGKNIPNVLEEHGEMLRMIEEKDTSGIETLLHRHLYGGIRRLGPDIYTIYADYFEPPEHEEPAVNS